MNMHQRVFIRRRAFKEARAEGAGIRDAKRAAERAWLWVNDRGRPLPLSDAPRCNDNPLWDEVEL